MRGAIVALVILFALAASVATGARVRQAPAGANRQTPTAPATGDPAAADPATIARGRAIYTQNCVACHGADARGGADAGADLSRSAIVAARDEGRQLIAFLKIGRPERRMPSFAMPDDDVRALSAYLRSILPATPIGGGMRGQITAIVVGDAKAGETYFNGAGGCTTCHSATGDLKGIGARLPVATIQGRIVFPRGNGGYPRSFNAPPDPNEPPRTVTITQPSGETVAGTLMWITDFYVTLTDAAGVRRTIVRNGDVPKVVVTEPLQYHIEHMQRLTDEDMHNLTAYLVSLK
jgi:cytochrome c oxidase cbb3-type subunit III